MFDEENFISLAIFLSFCRPHTPMTISQKNKNTVFFAKFSGFFSHNFLFCQIFALVFRFLRCIFFAKFLHYFLRNFRIFYFAKISYFSRNRLKEKFRIRGEIFRKIFAKWFFLFAANPKWDTLLLQKSSEDKFDDK